MKLVSITLFSLLLALSSFAQDDLAQAAAHFEKGEYAKAALVYERLFVKDKSNYDAVMGLGRSLYMQHENSRSMALFEKARRLRPESAQPYFWQGRVLERKGMADSDKPGVMTGPTLADAVRAYRQALDIDPKNVPAMQAATRVLFQLLRLDEALEMVERLLEVDPENETALITRLGLLYRMERLTDFLDACEASQGLIFIDLAKVLEAQARLGRFEAARATFDRMFEEGHAGTNTPFEVIRSAWSDGDRLPRQIDLLKATMKKRPDEHAARFYLGYALALSNDFAGARESFAAYLDVYPDDLLTRTHLARATRFAGDLDEAQKLIRAVVEANPAYEFGREELQGTVAALIGEKRFADALALHDLLYTQDMENASIMRDQSIILKENGRLEEAAKILKVLIDEYPIENSRLASYMNDHALNLKALGRIDEAKATFEEAIKTWDRQADARENLAVLLLEEGQLDRAEKLFQAAIAARLEDGADRELNLRSRYYLRLIERRRKS